MNTIKIINKKLRTYLEEKDILVTKGRKTSQDMEVLEGKILENNKKQEDLRNSVDISDLKEQVKNIQLGIKSQMDNLKDFLEEKFPEEASMEEVFYESVKHKAKTGDNVLVNLLNELDEVNKEVAKRKKMMVSIELTKENFDLKKELEELERERNKTALKVQKIKDRAIPIIRKEVKPKLAEYEDIEKTEVVGEQIVVTTFNHLEEWKDKFNKK